MRGLPAIINVVLVLVWLGFTMAIGRRHAELTGEGGKAPTQAETTAAARA